MGALLAGASDAHAQTPEELEALGLTSVSEACAGEAERMRKQHEVLAPIEATLEPGTWGEDVNEALRADLLHAWNQSMDDLCTEWNALDRLCRIHEQPVGLPEGCAGRSNSSDAFVWSDEREEVRMPAAEFLERAVPMIDRHLETALRRPLGQENLAGSMLPPGLDALVGVLYAIAEEVANEVVLSDVEDVRDELVRLQGRLEGKLEEGTP